jgi:hypothetical protein
MSKVLHESPIGGDPGEYMHHACIMLSQTGLHTINDDEDLQAARFDWLGT